MSGDWGDDYSLTADWMNEWADMETIKKWMKKRFPTVKAKKLEGRCKILDTWVQLAKKWTKLSQQQLTSNKYLSKANMDKMGKVWARAKKAVELEPDTEAAAAAATEADAATDADATADPLSCTPWGPWVIWTKAEWEQLLESDADPTQFVDNDDDDTSVEVSEDDDTSVETDSDVEDPEEQDQAKNSKKRKNPVHSKKSAKKSKKKKNSSPSTGFANQDLLDPDEMENEDEKEQQKVCSI